MQDICQSMRAILEDSDQMILITRDEDSAVLYANRASRRCFERDRLPEQGENYWKYLALEGDSISMEHALRLGETLEVRRSEDVFTIKGRSVQWCGEAAFVLYLTDCTVKKRLQNCYTHEIKDFLKGMPETLESYHLNLSRDSCLSVEETELPIEVTIHDTAEEVLRTNAVTMIDEEEKTEYFHKFNRRYLLKALDAGKSSVSMEARMQTRDGLIRWCRLTAKLAANPATGDVECILYAVYIDAKMVERLIINRAAMRGYDYMVLLNGSTGAYRLYAHGDAPNLPQEHGENYTRDMLQRLKRMVTEENYRALSADLDYAKIDRALQDNGSVEYIVSETKNTGETVHKKIQYDYLDRENHTILVLCSDVTTVVRGQQQQQVMLENALLAAKQANSAKSNFLSRMSHEIRTPLNAILGMCTLAANALGDQESVAEYISKIGISGHYLLTLINDILDMSRIESGKMLLRNEPFRMDELIGSINTVVYGQAEEKNINYEVIVDSNVAEGFIGDSMKLQQVLLNIVGNAVKFTPDGGKIVFAVHNATRTDKMERLRFTINDTGCGIEESFLDKVFEPFEQQDATTTTRYGGTGLGLAIAKSMVDMMGGSIQVRSIVGIGTEFTVEVPLELEPGCAPTKRRSSFDFSRLEALIVDDDVFVCEQTTQTLKEIGMRSDWVSSGRHAIEQVKALWDDGKYYDFILIDWKMPEMDGIETSRRIRKIVGPDVTIIIITAYDWTSIEHEAKLAGANMCISKPMFKSTLISAFERATGEVEERKRSEQTDYNFTGKRILLAEDHPLNAEIATKLLQAKGLTVEHAENGLRAVELFTTSPVGYYDAILMDIRMPLMDGLQATVSIRHWNRADAKMVPIIAMTANAFDEDVEKSRAAGMNDHLAKPIEPQLLYYTLSNYFSRE